MKKIKNKIEYLLKHNLFIQTIYRFIMSNFFRFIGLFVKIDKKLVLMNGHGYHYNDSPKAIFLKMKELGLTKKYKVVWALKNPDEVEIPECTKIKMDTLKYFITALKAQYWITCVNIERGLKFKKKKTIFLNTWHGGCIKLCGNAVSHRNDFHNEHVNYFCISGEYEREFTIRDYNVLPEAILPTGYPRNDELYQCNEEKILEYKKKLNLPLDKKIILYAPTWRDSEDGGNSYKLAPPIDWNKLQKDLMDEYIILLRTHPYTTNLMNVQFNSFVRDFSNYENIVHLYIVSDIMISDYSTAFLDYCILCKPMICFGYDYEDYKVKRGFYFDMEKTMPSGVIRNQNELTSYIKNMDYELECKKTMKFKNEHIEYGGNAAIECIKKVFKNEEIL